MAADKGGGGHGVEPVRLQRDAQLRQGVVKAAVAEGDHAHRQRAAALQLRLHIGQDLVGQLARISGQPDDHQISCAEPPRLRAGVLRREIHHAAALPQSVRQSRCKALHHPAGIAGGAPVHAPHLLAFHENRLPFFRGRPAPRHKTKSGRAG